MFFVLKEMADYAAHDRFELHSAWSESTESDYESKDSKNDIHWSKLAWTQPADDDEFFFPSTKTHSPYCSIDLSV